MTVYGPEVGPPLTTKEGGPPVCGCFTDTHPGRPAPMLKIPVATWIANAAACSADRTATSPPRPRGRL